MFQACVIFGSVTIFGIVSWYFTPEEKWLPRELLLRGLENTDSPEDDLGPAKD
jgi:translation initiation factor 5B